MPSSSRSTRKCFSRSSWQQTTSISSPFLMLVARLCKCEAPAHCYPTLARVAADAYSFSRLSVFFAQRQHDQGQDARGDPKAFQYSERLFARGGGADPERERESPVLPRPNGVCTHASFCCFCTDDVRTPTLYHFFCYTRNGPKTVKRADHSKCPNLRLRLLCTSMISSTEFLTCVASVARACGLVSMRECSCG